MPVVGRVVGLPVHPAHPIISLPPQLLGDVRAILKNFQQWPTAAQADSQYQTFIREQVRWIQRHVRNLAKSQLAPYHPLLPSPLSLRSVCGESRLCGQRGGQGPPATSQGLRADAQELGQTKGTMDKEEDRGAINIRILTYLPFFIQDIAMVLSGERAPQRELVKMAAARCGLSVPDAPSQEGISMEDGAKRGYTALRQTWRPDVKSEITKKYSGRVEKRIGKDEDDEK